MVLDMMLSISYVTVITGSQDLELVCYKLSPLCLCQKITLSFIILIPHYFRCLSTSRSLLDLTFSRRYVGSREVST